MGLENINREAVSFCGGHGMAPPCREGWIVGRGGMLSEKIENVRVALAELAGKVDDEGWMHVVRCRRELSDARDTAEIMESGLPLPPRAVARDDGEVLQ